MNPNFVLRYDEEWKEQLFTIVVLEGKNEGLDEALQLYSSSFFKTLYKLFSAPSGEFGSYAVQSACDGINADMKLKGLAYQYFELLPVENQLEKSRADVILDILSKSVYHNLVYSS